MDWLSIFLIYFFQVPCLCRNSSCRKQELATAMVLSENDAGKGLTTAAAKGNTAEVRRMLEECRVHPDTVNEFGRTALQVKYSSLTVCELESTS